MTRGLALVLGAFLGLVLMGTDVAAEAQCGGVDRNGRLQAPCAPQAASLVGRPISQCPAGSFADLGAATYGCWSCPRGFDRSLAAVDTPEACARPVDRNKPTYSAYASARLVSRGRACPAGSFLDIRNGGECWSCPTGYGRNTNPVDADNACSKLAEPRVSKARQVATLACPAGSFADPRNGGECWSCPAGYGRTLAAVTAPDACGKAFALARRATFVSKKTNACPAGSFADPRNGGECWSCPGGFDRSAAAVTAPNACVEPGDGRIVDYRPATFRALACGSETAFWDPRNGGECWSCPDDFARTVFPGVAGPQACGRLALDYRPATRTSDLGCKQDGEDAFWDPINGGTCWSCPGGTQRSVFPVNSPQACESQEFVWQPGPLPGGDPGLFGLDGAAEVAAHLIAERGAIDAIAEKIAADAKATDPAATPESVKTETWAEIEATPGASEALKTAVFSHMLDVALGQRRPATDGDQRLIAAFENYIQRRRVHASSEALAALDNWTRAQELRDQVAAERRGNRPDSMATLFDFGKVPPDFQTQIASAINVAAAGAMPIVAAQMAYSSGASAQLASTIRPFMQASDMFRRQVQNQLTRKIGERVLTEAARDQLKTTITRKLLASSASTGPAVILTVSAIILQIAIENFDAITDARPRLERLLWQARSEPVSLRVLHDDRARRMELFTYWAMAVAPLSDPPAGFNRAPAGGSDGTVPATVLILDGGSDGTVSATAAPRDTTPPDQVAALEIGPQIDLTQTGARLRNPVIGLCLRVAAPVNAPAIVVPCANGQRWRVAVLDLPGQPGPARLVGLEGALTALRAQGRRVLSVELGRSPRPLWPGGTPVLHDAETAQLRAGGGCVAAGRSLNQPVGVMRCDPADPAQIWETVP